MHQMRTMHGNNAKHSRSTQDPSHEYDQNPCTTTMPLYLQHLPSAAVTEARGKQNQAIPAQAPKARTHVSVEHNHFQKNALSRAIAARALLAELVRRVCPANAPPSHPASIAISPPYYPRALQNPLQRSEPAGPRTLVGGSAFVRPAKRPRTAAEPPAQMPHSYADRLAMGLPPPTSGEEAAARAGGGGGRQARLGIPPPPPARASGGAGRGQDVRHAARGGPTYCQGGLGGDPAEPAGRSPTRAGPAAPARAAGRTAAGALPSPADRDPGQRQSREAEISVARLVL